MTVRWNRDCKGERCVFDTEGGQKTCCDCGAHGSITDPKVTSGCIMTTTRRVVRQALNQLRGAEPRDYSCGKHVDPRSPRTKLRKRGLEAFRSTEQGPAAGGGPGESTGASFEAVQVAFALFPSTRRGLFRRFRTWHCHSVGWCRTAFRNKIVACMNCIRG